MRRHRWEPGNGTSYDLLLGWEGRPLGKVKVTGKADKMVAVLCWMRNGGSGGTCIAFNPDSYLADSYLSEKLDTNEADTRAISQFLGWAGFDTQWSGHS
tara:strand:+ start:270 stop:566 length:297 start_codon:yes stop_codon:yes gene_type:complete